LSSTGFSHALPRSVPLSFPPRISKGLANEHCISTWSDSQRIVSNPPCGFSRIAIPLNHK